MQARDSEPSTPSPAASKARGGRHLADHLAIVQSRWPWALAAFLLVLAWGVRRALLQSPVFVSQASLYLDRQGPAGASGLVSQMQAFESAANIQAELAVIASRSLAEETARTAGGRLSVLAEERNAYRPLEGLLRRLGDPSLPAHVLVEVDRLVQVPFRAALRFGKDEVPTLTVVDASSGVAERVVPSFAFGEPYTDANTNGRYDEPEPWVDLDGNGVFDPPEEYDDLNLDRRFDAQESWDDVNGNGTYDPPEPFLDKNQNRRRDADEPFTDRNGDGRWSPGEPFDDADNNDRWDAGDPYIDRNENGRFDSGDRFTDRDRDFVWDEGEPWVDENGNGVWDAGTPITIAGHQLRLMREAGDVRGRTFHLRGMTVSQVAGMVNASISAVEQGEYTGVIGVYGLAPSPYLARDVVNAVVRTYLHRKRNQKEEKANRLFAWLQTELNGVEVGLARVYAERDAYIDANDAVLLGERAQAAFEQQGQMVRELLSVEFERRKLRGRIEALQSTSTAAAVLTLLDISAVDSQTTLLVQRIATLELELARLTEKGVSERSDLYKDVTVPLRDARDRLERAAAGLRLRHLTELTERLSAADARLEAMREERDLYAALLERLPAQEQQLVLLGRPVQELETARSELARWMKDTQVAKASAVSVVRLIDEGTLNPSRVKPDLLRELLIAVLLAFAAAVGLCYLLEYLDRRMKDPREAEAALGLPLYATIPAFSSVARRDRPRRRRPLIAIDKPRSVLAEAYRSLRANLRFGHEEQPLCLLAITSPTQQEGKSLTTANLAATMAKAGDRVLVVDADLRRPSSHIYVGNDRGPGLTEVLEDGVTWQEVVRPGPIDGLSYIHAGRTPDNPIAILDSERFRRLVEEVRPAYDYVLFDVPPILAVADAGAFFRQLDGVMLLVHHRRYPLDLAETAQEQVLRTGANVLGLIYNGYDVRRSKGGSGYYGYGARYGYR